MSGELIDGHKPMTIKQENYVKRVATRFMSGDVKPRDIELLQDLMQNPQGMTTEVLLYLRDIDVEIRERTKELEALDSIKSKLGVASVMASMARTMVSNKKDEAATRKLTAEAISKQMQVAKEVLRSKYLPTPTVVKDDSPPVVKNLASDSERMVVLPPDKIEKKVKPSEVSDD